MKTTAILVATGIALSFGLGGCASDGGLALSTGSIDQQAEAKTQRIDPVCVALMAKIDELRKEGTPERIAKVATGKTKTASVKREALARMTELDKANTEFQQKCSTLAAPTAPATAPQAAAATPAQPVATAAATVANTAATTAKNTATQAANSATTAANTAAANAATTAVNTAAAKASDAATTATANAVAAAQ